MKLRWRPWALAAAALAPLAAAGDEPLGAAGDERLGAAGDELLVAAAVSLREPLVEIGGLYEASRPRDRLRFSFGASSALAVQARAGAPIDVLIAADERIVDRLVAEGLVAPEERFPLAGNRLVVVERPGLGLAGPEDLASPRLRRIAVPAREVPVGRYAREWLAARGLLARLESRIAATEHARATLAAVERGAADAAIVYATDARLARSAQVAFAVPDGEQPNIVYTAALLRDAPEPRGGRRFFDFLGSAPAKRALADAGFSAPRR